jgi:hypothetical protein
MKRERDRVTGSDAAPGEFLCLDSDFGAVCFIANLGVLATVLAAGTASCLLPALGFSAVVNVFTVFGLGRKLSRRWKPRRLRIVYFWVLLVWHC